MDIIEKALEYRVVNRLTQVEMAERLGVSRDTYHSIETKKRPLSKVVRKKIELLLNITERSN